MTVMDTRRDGSPILEATLESYLQTKVRKVGGMIFKIAPVVRGLPDRCVLIPFGRAYFVEMKKADGRISAAQYVWHERAGDIGHVVHVLRSKAEVDAFVRWALDTGMGLKNGKKQRELDIEAVKTGYADPWDLI